MTHLALASDVRSGDAHPARNGGIPLDLSWVQDVRINLSAAERRVASLPGRRAVKKDAQAAWLLKAVTCMDLTTLNGDDTAERVKRLCAKARSPVRPDVLAPLAWPNAASPPARFASITASSRRRWTRWPEAAFPSPPPKSTSSSPANTR